jgi:cytochrome c oxidase subunit 2
MFAAAVVVLVIVYGGIFYTGVRYRERPGVPAQQIHGHDLLELLWTVIPTIMVISFSVLSFQRLLVLNDVNTGAEMTVKVEGRQWQFTFNYPNDFKGTSFMTSDGPLTTTEQLDIPVNTKVRLEMRGQDVIHSFWIPNLGGKMDLIPGRTTYLALQADRVGEFKGQCFEFCGNGHADMLLRVVVHPTSDYAAWAKKAVEDYDRRNSPETKAGRELFKSLACAGCHTIQGLTAGRVGPELTHIASRPNIAGALSPVNEENLKKWLANPPGVKPGTQMPNLGLDQDAIAKITQFLLTQK